MSKSHLERFIKVYEDVQCKKPLEKVSFGLSRKMDVYLLNTFPHRFEVEELEFFDEDVTCESMNNEDLLPNVPTKITLVFSPKEDRKTMLNTTFLIHGRYIIEP